MIISEEIIESIESLIDNLNNIGILHDDLHSGNIVLSNDLRDIIIDFGESMLIKQMDKFYIKKYNLYHELEDQTRSIEKIFKHEIYNFLIKKSNVFQLKCL